MATPTSETIGAALAQVNDPEINRPLTELGMVDSVEITPMGHVTVTILLTISGCPMKARLTEDVTNAVMAVDGVTGVEVRLGVMNDEQRAELSKTLKGTDAERVVPFSQPNSLTKVYAISSGKGGVGKSSVTVNLATALAKQGLRVGIVDADVYGFSVPGLLGVTTAPTQLDKGMILPPIAHDVKVISIGMFIEGNQAVVWRGPMLHRALEQFLADVFWGDLDVLLLDLPPGTGDIAISISQLLPSAEILVVTTPQSSSAEVAERAGAIASQTKQRVAGVIENMSWMEMPDGSRLDVFGTGGGERVAANLSEFLGQKVPLLGQIPLDTEVRTASDDGMPISIANPESPAAVCFNEIAQSLAANKRGLVGRPLGVSPA